MKSKLVSALFGFGIVACATASPTDFCDIVSLEESSKYIGKTVVIEGKAILYSDEDGTKVFLSSTCPVSFFGSVSEQRAHVLLSDIDEGLLLNGNAYSAKGILQKVSTPIYDGPVYAFVLNEPIVEEKIGTQ